MKFKIFLALFIIFCQTLNAFEISTEQVKVGLISKSEQDFFAGRIGVYYKMIPGWHIYWRNPGDSGAAPKFKINGKVLLPSGWPTPKRLPVAHLVNYGYEKEVAIFLDLGNFTEGSVLDLEWLVCKVDCIPGFGKIAIKKENVSFNFALWNRFQNRIPQKFDRPIEFIGQNSESLSFLFPTLSIKEMHLFPFDGNVFSSQAAKISTIDSRIKITAFKTSNGGFLNNPASFTAVIDYQDGRSESFDFQVIPEKDYEQFFWGLLFAFLGGLILNLMPCVFPVLFLKAYGFLKTKDPKSIQKSSLYYSAGVLVSFLILGGFVVLFQVTGKALGWGFQMQSPFFIIFLIILFLLMTLGFLDILKFNRLALPKSLQPYLSSDFGTGVLAVVVASPCTAPFMGTALGLTLALPPIQSLMIFLTLGLGLAIPVPVLAFWPSLISKLPKSGNWMVKVKKLMAIPLLATCIWLGWVLYSQISFKDLNGIWSPYDEAQIEEIKKSQSVFIDFTAKWCITCQVNKQTVLDTVEIMELFKSHNVFLVRADWTNYNSLISKALIKHNRNSVPFYVFYDIKTKREIILPELLTKNVIKKLFNKGDGP